MTYVILTVVYFVIGFALAELVKRFTPEHDLDKTTYWIIVMWWIPVVFPMLFIDMITRKKP